MGLIAGRKSDWSTKMVDEWVGVHNLQKLPAEAAAEQMLLAARFQRGPLMQAAECCVADAVMLVALVLSPGCVAN